MARASREMEPMKPNTHGTINEQFSCEFKYRNDRCYNAEFVFLFHFSMLPIFQVLFQTSRINPRINLSYV